MSDGDMLLRAILRNPDEDTPRLVYADWLEENGQPNRAESIRHAIGKQTPPFRFASGKGAYVWLDWGELRGVFLHHPISGTSLTVHRGFVSEICLPAASFTEGVARELFSKHPVTDVRLTDRVPDGISGTDEYPSAWWCAEDVPGNHPRTMCLPKPIMARLPRRGYFDGWEKAWLVRKAKSQADAVRIAHVALSDACTMWGRELVGLDPPPEHAAK